jgi:hypothetical protein
MYMTINWWLQSYGRQKKELILIGFMCTICKFDHLWIVDKKNWISTIEFRNYHFYKLSLLKFEILYVEEKVGPTRVGQGTNFGHSTI